MSAKKDDDLDLDEEDDLNLDLPEDKPKATGPAIDLYEDDVPAAKPAEKTAAKAAEKAVAKAPGELDDEDLIPKPKETEKVVEKTTAKVEEKAPAIKPLDLGDDEDLTPKAKEAKKVEKAVEAKPEKVGGLFGKKDEEPKAEKKAAAPDTTKKTTAEPAESKTVAKAPAEKTTAPKPETTVKEPKEPATPSAASRFAGDTAAADERTRMGVPWGDYAKYKDSGLDEKAWLQKAQVHAGHAYLEVAGGFAMGDVDRGYGVRVAIDGEYQNTAVSSWAGSGTSASGGGPTGRIAVGYTPTWYLDTSVAFGLQGGQKHLNVGWYCGDLCKDAEAETDYPSVDATQLVIEPRARVLPLATGLVKPYGLVGLNLSIYDAFHIPDENNDVNYPDAAGGVSFGPTVGAGVMIDPVSPVSILVEVPFTIVAADGSTSSTDSSLPLTPTTLEHSGWVLRLTAGVQVRL